MRLALFLSISASLLMVACNSEVGAPDRSVEEARKTLQAGTLQPYVVSPLTETAVSLNGEFTFSTGVKCLEGDCGNVSATLDPILNLQAGEDRLLTAIRAYGSEPGEIFVAVSLGKLEHTSEDTTAGPYSLLSLVDHGFTSSVGDPRLPVIRKSVEIPYGGDARIEVAAYHVEEYSLEELGIPHKVIPVFGTTPPQFPGDREGSEFRINESTYGRNAYVLNQIASASAVGVIRGHRFLHLEVFPVDYNPAAGRIKVYREVTVKISIENPDLRLTQAQAQRYYSLPFELANKNSFVVNPSNPYRLLSSQVRGGKLGYLIITAPQFKANAKLLGFVTERSKTFDVTLVDTTQTGTSKESIKAYIENAYRTGAIPPVYVLLIGDTNTVPYWFGDGSKGAPTDLYYSTMDGSSDLLADVYLGRFSVRTDQDLNNLITKTLTTSDLKKTALTASNQEFLTTEAEDQWVIDNYFTPNGWLAQKIYGNSGGNASDITSSINGGVTFFIHSGDGGEQSWNDPAYSQSDVWGLTNSVYPFVFANACYTGNYFEFDEAISESFTISPRGAAAYIGASKTVPWGTDVPNSFQTFIVQASFDPSTNAFGQTLNSAKNIYYQKFGIGNSQVQNHLEEYNLLGDPSRTVLGVNSTTTTSAVKGVIPMNSGSPFYTTNKNPVMAADLSCLQNMKAGSVCEQTWTVKVTGGAGGTFDFFTIYSSDSASVPKAETNRVKISVVN